MRPPENELFMRREQELRELLRQQWLAKQAVKTENFFLATEAEIQAIAKTCTDIP